MHDTFTGPEATIAIVLCVVNTVIVLAFLVHMWLQGWVIRRAD